MNLKRYHENAAILKSGIAPNIIQIITEQEKVINSMQKELAQLRQECTSARERLQSITRTNIILKRQIQHQGILNEYTHNKEASNRPASITHK